MQQKASTKQERPRLSLEEKLRLANRLYRERYAECFWHMKPDLVVTEELLPIIIKALRENGGRHEFLEAAKLAG